MADRAARKQGKRAAQLAKMDKKADEEAHFFWQCVDQKVPSL